MRHARLTDLPPGVLDGVGLFDDISPSAPALIEAPIVRLSDGEKLDSSRDGASLLMVVIRGNVVVRDGGSVVSYGRGALVGVAEVLLGVRSNASVRASSDSVLLLIDRTRLNQLVELSAHFSHNLSKVMFGCQQTRDVISARHNAASPSLIDVAPAGIRCVVLVRLINREALQLCHGPVAVTHAAAELEAAVCQAIRPLDVYLRLSTGESVVGLDGDMLSAAIVATRLIARASRVVVFGDMHTALPHLHVVVGIAALDGNDTLGEAVDRARDFALRASRAGATVGGAVA